MWTSTIKDTKNYGLCDDIAFDLVALQKEIYVAHPK